VHYPGGRPGRFVGHGIVFHIDNLFDYNLLKPFKVEDTPRIINKIPRIIRTNGVQEIIFECKGSFLRDVNQNQASTTLHIPIPIFDSPILTCLGCRNFENSIWDEIDKLLVKLSAVFPITPLNKNRMPLMKRNSDGKERRF
jgi:hypothetical protein